MQSVSPSVQICHGSRPTFIRLDGRSREARFRKLLRADLVRHVGSSPSATQTALIELAVDAAVALERLKQSNAAGVSADHQAAQAWQASYRDTLALLGPAIAP